MLATATLDSHYYTCHEHLGWHNTDRNISIGYGKHRSDCHVLLSLLFLCTNFAYVHEPLAFTMNSWKDLLRELLRSFFVPLAS
jgi:hypothetical protein